MVWFTLTLRSRINQDWFSAILDLAIASNGSDISEIELENIWTYLLGKNQYIKNASTISQHTQVTQNGTTPVFLENIFGFDNFKKLSPNLKLSFDKKVTLIFGKNGSGKSSLCQALKVLSSPEKPIAPIYNARESVSVSAPSFSYQFQGWSTPNVWSEVNGFGSQSQFIKYFDSTVAISNITGKMRVENAIVVSVFRLELFDYVRSFLIGFQKYSTNKISQCQLDISTEMNTIFSQLSSLVNINIEPFVSWKPESSLELEEWLKNQTSFGEKEEQELILLEGNLQQLQTATSEQGIIALKGQLTIIKRTKTQLITLVESCKKGELSNLQNIETRYPL